MYNVIHGKTIRLDQHSGAHIREGETIFKIPTFGIDGRVHWKGCYGTPSTALAALKTYADKKKYPEEKHKEIVNIFIASLSRVDKEDPVTKDKHLTIVAAPPPSMLKLFDGPLSYDEYYKRFDEEGLMRTVFGQRIPDAEQEGASNVESIDQVKGQPSDWNCVLIPHDGKSNNDYLQALPSIKVQVPRNIGNTLNWLQEAAAGRITSETGAFAVILHPDKKNVVTIANPAEWHEGPHNNLASNLLGHQPVFGDALYISKSLPAYKKKKQQKGAKPKAVPKEEPSVKKAMEKEDKEPASKRTVDVAAKSPKMKTTARKQKEDEVQEPAKKKRKQTEN